MIATFLEDRHEALPVRVVGWKISSTGNVRICGIEKGYAVPLGAGFFSEMRTRWGTCVNPSVASGVEGSPGILHG
jgi:hypothetical protein